MSDLDLKQVADKNELSVAHVKAVIDVESKGYGFYDDGTPIILFEGHKFHKYTKGKYSYDSRYEDISYPEWTKKYYKGTQEGEYDRLQRASVLDLEAALKSTSWGMFQIMGFNYKKAGYKSVKDFVTAMGADEREQLEAFMKFIKNTKRKGKSLLNHLRDNDWVNFAIGYNGKSQHLNNYSGRLKKAYERYN